MPRYFFDDASEQPQQDDNGVEFACAEDMQKVGKQTLFDMARERVPCDGERCCFSMVVRDEAGTPVYVATLNCEGITLTGSA